MTGVASRPFGRTTVQLSALAFGPMRLDPRRVTSDEALALVEHLHANGVTTFHSSHEYETHPFFCDVLRRFRERHPGASLVHVVKLAMPHFDEARFDAARLRQRVESALLELGAEQLHVVQWLVRSKPLEDEARLHVLAECAADLAEVWGALQHEGKVGVLASFPYSTSFADAVLDLPPCEGLVTYLNLAELEMAPRLDAMAARGLGFMAIRPLFAGALRNLATAGAIARSAPARPGLRDTLDALGVRESDLTSFALRFPLLHPAVTSVLLGVTTRAHADEAVAAVGGARVDRARFYEIVAALDHRA